MTKLDEFLERVKADHAVGVTHFADAETLVKMVEMICRCSQEQRDSGATVYCDICEALEALVPEEVKYG